MVNNYFETLGATVDEIVTRLAADNIILETYQGTPTQIILADLSPVDYGYTIHRSYSIVSLNGKPTRKFFHVSISRLSSGRYELTTYAL